jgi:hypothetical protein
MCEHLTNCGSRCSKLFSRVVTRHHMSVCETLYQDSQATRSVQTVRITTQMRRNRRYSKVYMSLTPEESIHAHWLFKLLHSCLVLRQWLHIPHAKIQINVRHADHNLHVTAPCVCRNMLSHKSWRSESRAVRLTWLTWGDHNDE